jgi:hypothetical protein
MMQYGLELRNRISNHVMGGIDSVYNKFTYDEPAREFLQVWADKPSITPNQGPSNSTQG